MDTNSIIIVFLIVIIIIMLSKNHNNSSNSSEQSNGTVYVKPIGGCSGTRYGCCPNGVTARRNLAGTNCR